MSGKSCQFITITLQCTDNAVPFLSITADIGYSEDVWSLCIVHSLIVSYNSFAVVAACRTIVLLCSVIHEAPRLPRQAVAGVFVHVQVSDLLCALLHTSQLLCSVAVGGTQHSARARLGSTTRSRIIIYSPLSIQCSHLCTQQNKEFQNYTTSHTLWQ